MAGRNTLYDFFPSLSQAVTVPVICVGNLTTGGTGKTPMVAYLADYFQRKKIKVAILSRGYGRIESKKSHLITKDSPTNHVAGPQIGDEAMMLHQQVPDAALVLDGDRIRGAKTALKQFMPDLILMDDGFQHRRLRRNFNLIMIDSQKLFGNRRLLPGGPLREPLKSLKRADAVVLNKFDQRHPDFYQEAAEILNHISPTRIFCASYNFSQFSAADGRGSLNLDGIKNLGPLCACAGLANNDYFFAQLRYSGLEVEKTASFPDHYNYNKADLIRLLSLSASRPLITTAKDGVKLKTLAETNKSPLLQQLWIAEIGLKIEHDDKFLSLFTDFIDPQSKTTNKPAHP